MNRLTERYDEYIAHIPKEYIGKNTGYSLNSGIICEKLGAYEDLEEQGLLVKLPCQIGETVYRICPKCNDKHNQSCENCAWRFSLAHNGCNVYGLWSDGQYAATECHVVPYKVSWNYIPNLLEHLGKTVFLTKEEAEKELKRLAG